VIRVLKGRDRAEAERFVALRSHYGFDSFFCIPGPEGAHEKGGVEGEIGRFRRRHLTPVPSAVSLAELNQLIAAADIAGDGRAIHDDQWGQTTWRHSSATATSTHTLGKPASPRSSVRQGDVRPPPALMPSRCERNARRRPARRREPGIGGAACGSLGPA
jgi:hypothetical protein